MCRGPKKKEKEKTGIPEEKAGNQAEKKNLKLFDPTIPLEKNE
jgi:hypothetical protein